MPLIRNKKTGEMLNVPEAELATYNPSMPAPAEPALSDGSSAIDMGETPDMTQMQKPRTITGRTIEEHASALNKAKLAGDKTAIKQITDDFDREYAYQKDVGLLGKPEKESAKEKEAKKAKSDIRDAAIAVNEVLNNKDRYGSEKEYKKALEYAASRLSAKQGFGEGGKVLSPAELGILSGSLINIMPQREQTWFDRTFTGYVPPATGEIADDEEEIRYKMNNAISYINTGKLPPPQQPQNSGEGMNVTDAVKGVGKFIGDAVDQVTDISQDAAAGINANMTEEARNKSNTQALQQAKLLGDMATKEQDPQKRAALFKQSNDLIEAVRSGNDEVIKSFSEDVMVNPAFRGLEAGATIAGAAEIPGAVALGKQLLTHPVQSAKAIAGGVKSAVTHPIQTGKEFIKQDFDNSLTRQPLTPKMLSIDEATQADTPPVNPEIAQTGKPNVVQKTLRHGADLVQGGGSDEYVARQAKNPWLPPQNEVIMNEGIYSRPTHTGRVQRTNTALANYGKELEQAYTNSPAQFDMDALKVKGIEELMENGVPPQDAKKIVAKVFQDLEANGSFQLGKGTTAVDAKTLWKGTRWLEKYNPNIPKDPDATAYLKQNSKVLTRMLRGELGDAVPETQITNGKYSALKDFSENDYELKSGAAGAFGGGILKPITAAVKNTANTVSNTLSNPKATIKSYTQKPTITLADGSSPVANESAIPVMNPTPEKVVPGKPNDFPDMSPATTVGKGDPSRKIIIEKPKEETLDDYLSPERILKREIQSREKEIAYIAEHDTDHSGRLSKRDIPNLRAVLNEKKKKLTEFTKKK